MKELSLERMEEVKGGNLCTISWAIAGIALGAIYGTITFGVGIIVGVIVAGMGEVACYNS